MVIQAIHPTDGGTFWHRLVIQTLDINAVLARVTPTAMVGINPAVRAEEVFSDTLVPLVQTEMLCASKQRKICDRHGFHDDALFAAKGAVAAV